MYERLAFVLSEVFVGIVQTDSHTFILISPISDLINNDDQHKATDQYNFIHNNKNRFVKNKLNIIVYLLLNMFQLLFYLRHHH